MEYKLSDIYNLTKSSIYLTTVIGHIEQMECTCDTEGVCTRCDFIDRVTDLREDVNVIIGI